MLLDGQLLYLLLIIIGVIAVIYIILYLSSLSQKKEEKISNDLLDNEDNFENDEKDNRFLDIGVSKSIGDSETQVENVDVLINNDCCMAVLTDGITENSYCKTASEIASKSFKNIFERQENFENINFFLNKMFNIANHNILSVLSEKGKSTAACAIINRGKLYYGLVGESKISVYRNNSLIQISVGHTISAYVKQEFEKGTLSRKKTLSMLNENTLYNYLGVDGFKNVELLEVPVELKSGDIVVIMSNGVFNTISCIEIEKYLGQLSNCATKSRRIIGAIDSFDYLEKGNSSIILIKYNGRQVS